jgi:membrane protein YqaA with SNARE-associated domain
VKTTTKNYLACGWGFAEATLFFILPDVLLSYFALDRKERLLRLILCALAGAIVGGIIMYYRGFHSPQTAWHWVEAVPAINSELMNSVGKQLNVTGVSAIILGPLQGLPYKTYAVQAVSAGIGLPLFVLFSVVARLLRFMLIAYVARVVSFGLIRYLNMTQKTILLIWIVAWTSVYALYFFHFPS